MYIFICYIIIKISNWGGLLYAMKSKNLEVKAESALVNVAWMNIYKILFSVAWKEYNFPVPSWW